MSEIDEGLITGESVVTRTEKHWIALIGDSKWAILALEGGIWRGFGPAEMLLPVVILIATGVVAFTVAVRTGEGATSAISPKKSPGPILLIRLPPLRTSASPSRSTKNSRPPAPSRISSLPSRRSTSSARVAISASSRFEQRANSGTFRSSSTFWLRRSTG